MTNETTNEKGGKRSRRTRVEQLEFLRQKMAKIEAQIAGNFDETQDDSYMVTRLKRAIRKRETALKAAGTLLNGRAATENSPAISAIAVKIANAETKLANLRTAVVRATEAEGRLPFDIATLRETLERASKGETVDFPEGLFVLPNEATRTEAEIEAGSVVSEQD